MSYAVRQLVKLAPKSIYFSAKITKSGAVWYQDAHCEQANYWSDDIYINMKSYTLYMVYSSHL